MQNQSHQTPQAKAIFKQNNRRLENLSDEANCTKKNLRLDENLCDLHHYKAISRNIKGIFATRNRQESKARAHKRSQQG
ncbi:MAG: hypothetical protein K8963_00005 [Proteobacteria bacterium]|nr:hypothetical protein [Pseudomonadota bacterium]